MRARSSGVQRMVAVGGTLSLNQGAEEAARAFPEHIQAALGWDRHAAAELRSAGMAEASWRAVENRVRALSAQGVRVVALGEMGLDFQSGEPALQLQQEVFRVGLAAAQRMGLPVIIHSRSAETATLTALDDGPPTPRRGVLHCFTGSQDFARRLLNRGLYISFSGILTFRNAEALRATARFIPEDHLLVETDAPYLAPEPMRGRPNEPAFLPHIVACLATVRGVPPEHIADVTFRNAERLFGSA